MISFSPFHAHRADTAGTVATLPQISVVFNHAGADERPRAALRTSLFRIPGGFHGLHRSVYCWSAKVGSSKP
jgi:hypothetical protein